MHIGEQRRTVYIEPIEEPPDDPILEPTPEAEPLRRSPSGCPSLPGTADR
jgi:hypothetical protein